MPKAAKSKSARAAASAHQPSVKPVKRQFAVQDNAVEHVDVGSLAAVSAQEILDDITSGDAPHEQATLKKKEKLAIKKDAFRSRLGADSTSHPYSKSHSRRMKRKAREQVAGGLSDMQDAIGDLLNDEAPAETIAESNNKATKGKKSAMDVEGEEEPKKTPQAGVIGQGKSSTLTKAQRKRALELERLRHPQILSNPAYSSNPFETIRTHAQNTLVKHQPS